MQSGILEAAGHGWLWRKERLRLGEHLALHGLAVVKGVDFILVSGAVEDALGLDAAEGVLVLVEGLQVELFGGGVR